MTSGVTTSPTLSAVDPGTVRPRATDLDAAKAREALCRRDALILRELTLLADASGLVSLSQIELASATRQSPRSVRTGVKSLIRLGWIGREPINLGKAGRANDRYTVHASPQPLKS